ncbi:MAG: BMP family ABC transporter substrate-binding protein [Lachnospiraceae bacterium]|nr:BMP family ABC transporter substrate-binding protein [Lachnospiraceae bacterium]
MAGEYAKAKRLGERAYRRAVFNGRYPYLPALEAITEQSGSRPEISVGIQELPLNMIAGTRTIGRQNAFACNFMPLLPEKSEFALKWEKLVEAQVDEGFREPIKVYEYMKQFYVQEGNKRVSVARYLDMPTIAADIIRILPERTQSKESQVYYEFLEFFKVAPIYEITFSEPGYYKKLAELIGRDLTEPWPDAVVEYVRSAYRNFERYYYSLRGGALNITAGDAFLTYLTVFRLDCLLTEDGKAIKRRLGRLWNEFLTETNDNMITLVDEPAEADKKDREGLLRSLKKGPAYTEAHPLGVAFVYDKTPEESRWIYSHDLGRQDLEQRMDGLVRTDVYTGCSTEEAFTDAVEAAAAAGDEMIVTTSPVQMEMALRAAIRHPEIRFLNCSVNLSRNAVRAFYGRMYEAKFLLGALAASLAEDPVIGYQADYPIYGNIACINAFAIGAALINPDCKVRLTWSTQKDTNWQQTMWEEGIRIISGPDSIKPQNTSREYGVYRIDEDGKVTNLAMPVVNWGLYYELIVRTVLKGTWNARAMSKKDQSLGYWYGMSSGVVDVVLSEKIPYSARKLVQILKQALMADTLNPFEGELHSQEGILQGADAPRLSYEEIIRMNWLNDNVIGALPELEHLYEEAKPTVIASGVKTEHVTPKIVQAGKTEPEA